MDFEPERLLLLVLFIHDELLGEELLIINQVRILPQVHGAEHKAAKDDFGQVEPRQTQVLVPVVDLLGP